MIRALRLLFVAATATSRLAAQTTITMAKPDAEFSEPFTTLRGFRELPNGKVLVSDFRDKVVQLVDFAAGTATKVGREGQGPGEYALPMSLFAMPDGVTWIEDILGRRFLPVDANGKIGDPIPMPGQGARGFVMAGGAGWSDAKGGIYGEAPPFNIDNPNAPPADSVPVRRWKRGSEAMDTVAWIVKPKSNVQATGGGGQFSVRIGGNKVFTPEEKWGVAADGSVARVTPNPYRVIWYDATGKPTAGPVVSYTPLKVTAADKKDVIERRKKQRPMMIAMGGNGRAPAGAVPNVELPPPEFEDTKPPFLGNDGGRVLVTPEGEVWVLRTRPAGDATPSYDVFDRSGKLVRKVALNPSSTILGFGKGTAYVIRTDEDDLQYLQRFRR